MIYIPASAKVYSDEKKPPTPAVYNWSYHGGRKKTLHDMSGPSLMLKPSFVCEDEVVFAGTSAFGSGRMRRCLEQPVGYC